MIKSQSPFTVIEQDNHRYLWYKGQLIYKQWLGDKSNKTEPSLLFSRNGWPANKVY